MLIKDTLVNSDINYCALIHRLPYTIKITKNIIDVKNNLLMLNINLKPILLGQQLGKITINTSANSSKSTTINSSSFKYPALSLNPDDGNESFSISSKQSKPYNL